MVESVALAALTTTVPDGTVAGAVYSPEDEIVPSVELPPLIPFTPHVTAVLELSLTVAENCCVCPTGTEALVGEIETKMPESIAMAAWAERVGSAALTANTVIVPEGAVAGAVYNPEEEIVPTVKFPPAMPFTVQVTAVFDVPVTVALNCWAAPS